MKFIIILITSFVFTFHLYGQVNYDTAKASNQDDILSKQDSILLQKFWTTFKTAVITKDKIKLSTSFKFPFTCVECLDDTTIKHHNPYYITVTRSLFEKKCYRFFLERQVLQFVNENQLSQISDIFGPSYNEKQEKIGYEFGYIVSSVPGTELSEKVFIYLEKINGEFKITGTDTVP
jgi:hypothetical protein